MLTGNIFITTSVEDVMKNAPTHFIICISGETHNYKQMIDATNAMEASILLPPYEALSAEIDNNMQEFETKYFMHLSCNAMASEFIGLILKALYNGKNIILYLTPDEAQMAYISYFSLYFNRYLGITIGTDATGQQAAFDTNYIPVVLTNMLINNLFDPVEYMIKYPLDKPLPNESVAKLSKLFNPALQSYNHDMYVKYLDDYRKNLIETGKPLISPFMKG